MFDRTELGRPSELERLSKLTDEELNLELIEDIAQAQKLIEHGTAHATTSSSAAPWRQR